MKQAANEEANLKSVSFIECCCFRSDTLFYLFISLLFHFPLCLPGKYNPQQPKYLRGKKTNK